jgi:raffinose/stachyose/melibiose transport system permease protein
MKTNSISIKKLLSEIALLLLTAIWSIPIFITLFNGVKDSSEIMTNPNGIPQKPVFGNLITAFIKGEYAESFVTSILLAFVSTVMIIIICSSVAYPLARIKSRFNNVLYMFFLAGIMVPSGLTMIPLYKLLGILKIINTPVALIPIYISIHTPFVVFIFSGFMKTIPIQLDESAKIDGCTPYYTYWKVIFPLLKPVTATAVIMVSVPIFNDFMNPLLYASKLKTVTLSLYRFSSSYYTDWNMIFAGVTLTVIPPLIIFFIFQKQFEKGLVAGAVKG